MAHHEIRQSRFVGAFAAYVAVCLAACGGRAGIETGGSAPPVTQEALPSALAGAFCEGLGACCQSVGIVADVASCEALMRGRIGSRPTQAAIQYDPVLGGQCVAEIRTTTSGCYQSNEENAGACGLMYAGLVPLGGSCNYDEECATPSDGRAICSNWMCVAIEGATRGTLGQHCSTTCGTDAIGTYCIAGAASDGNAPAGAATCYAEDGLYCDMQLWTCLAQGEVGGECSSDLFGCVGAAHCNMEFGLCEPDSAVGEPCSSSHDCVLGTYCDAVAGFCQQKKNDGDSCRFADECVGYCQMSLPRLGTCFSGPERFVPTESLCQGFASGDW